MSTGKVALGALAGLAIGAIAGILFAPEKGSVTRRQIMDKGDEYVDGAKSKYNDMRDSITDKYESTKRDAEEFVNRSKAKFGQAKRNAENVAADFKNDAEAEFKETTS